MLALGIRYLTGYAVATDVSSREHAEWPPHPARVFMAMAAAMFESGEVVEEREALLWLEQQGSPSLTASNADARNVVTHYVPVNDKSDPVKGNKTSTPLQTAAIGRDRQPRTFPRVRPWDDTMFLVWPEADLSQEHRAALNHLCNKVTRIGHSSSLVQMWLEPSPPECNLIPEDLGEQRLRVVSAGTLDYLETAANVKTIERCEELAVAIAQLKEEKKAVKGKGSKERKSEIEAKIAEHEQALETLNPHEPLRPTISLWQGYSHVDKITDTAPIASGFFERELIILTIQEGPVVGLESTWRLMTALHKTILAKCDPAPEWLSGHTEDKQPSQSPHVAMFPLAFVGQEYADGHLMGIALAMPKGIAPRERGRALRGLFYDDNGRPRPIVLKAGSLGAWTLVRETRPTPPLTLQDNTWIRPGNTWASVTPIVLDHHPKTDYSKDRQGWTIEVAKIIAASCLRQGLPDPVAIDVDKTSWHRGAPRAVGGKSAGYPRMPVKEGQPSRQQVHAWIQFDQRVEGPLLLGAGRYRGYGLCRPWKEQR